MKRCLLMRGWLVLLLPAEVAIASATCFADDDPGAVAEALFRNGRELMAAGDLTRACPKFAESQRIDPKLGTLMNLALCHEKEGKVASAWVEYIQAADIAKRVGQREREQLTRERAAALEPTLPRVTIEASPLPGLAVALDEKPLGAGAFGTPVPVDPGEHVVRATAPGMKPYSQSFTVAAGSGSVRNVVIPQLEPDTALPPAPPPAAIPPEPPRAVVTTTSPDHAGGVQRTVGLAVGGAGVAGLIVGGVFGLMAKSTYDHALSAECNGSRDACTPAGARDGKGADTQADVSTAAFIAGAALCAGGAVLFFTAPKVGVDVGSVATTREAGLVVRGAW